MSDKINSKESNYLYIALSQLPNSGQGLFTTIDLYKDEIVSLFKGEVLTDRQAELRIKKGHDAYFINMLDGKILDSMKTNCFAKFANDAKGSSTSLLKNNTFICIDENNNVCLQASKNIKRGSEIFCNYGNLYWKKHRK